MEHLENQWRGAGNLKLLIGPALTGSHCRGKENIGRIWFFSYFLITGRADSSAKTLMLRKTESRRRGKQRMRWLAGITSSMDMSLSKLREMVKGRGAGVLQFMELQRVGLDFVTEQQQKQYCTLVTCNTDVFR